MSRSLSAKISIFLISFILTAIRPQAYNITERLETLRQKGISGSDGLFEAALLKELRGESITEDLFTLFEEETNPLNLDFYAYYLLENEEVFSYKERFFDALKKKKCDDPVFLCDAAYIMSILKKYDLRTFSKEEWGYLDDYFVCGPFIEKGILDFENVFPFERTPNVKKEYSTYFGKIRPYAARSNYAGWVDLRTIYSDPFGIVYFASSFEVPAAGNYYVNLLSTVPYKLFIDGVLVHQRRKKDHDKGVKEIIRLDLSKGGHTVLMKTDAGYSFGGYEKEDIESGFSVQLLSGDLKPLKIRYGQMKKGSMNGHKIFDPAEHFGDYSSIERYNFKLAAMYNSYGNGVKSHELASLLARDSDSPVYGLFAGIICDKYPAAGFKDYSFDYLMNSYLEAADNTIAMLFLAKYYLNDNNLEEAKVYLRKIEETRPDFRWTRYFKALVKSREGMKLYASELMSGVSDPVSPNMIDLAAVDYLISSNDHARALEILRSLEARGVVTIQCIISALTCFLETKDHSGAAEYLSKLPKGFVENDLQTAGIFSRLAVEGFEPGKTYGKLIETYPQNLEYYLMLADHVLNRGKTEEYISLKRKIMDKFFEADPELDAELFGSGKERGNYDGLPPKKDFPIEIIDERTEYTFFKDLSCRRADYGLIRINDQKGVSYFTNFRVQGDLVFLKVIGKDGKEYLFHSSSGNAASLKGLEEGALIEYASFSYHSRPYLHLFYNALPPITFQVTIPIERYRVSLNIPKELKISSSLLNQKNLSTLKYSKTSDLQGYFTYKYEATGLNRVRSENMIPQPYVFLASLLVGTKLDPALFVSNFYFELFPGGELSHTVEEYFESFKGDPEEKMKVLYEELQTKFTGDDDPYKNRTLPEIIKSRKAEYIDKLRVFKAGLEIWNIPHEFVVYTDYTTVDTAIFNHEIFTGHGIIVPCSGKNILVTFSESFVPFGGEAGILRKAYLTADGLKVRVAEALETGIENEVDVRYEWRPSENFRLTALISFKGLYASAKQYFFDENTKDSIVRQFISSYLPFLELTDYKLNCSRDTSPFEVGVSGIYEKKNSQGIFLLPMKPAGLTNYFSADYPRSLPLVITQLIVNKDECIIRTDKELEEPAFKYSRSVKGVFDYDIRMTRTDDGAYKIVRTLQIYPALYYPDDLERILPVAYEVDKSEELYFLLGRDL